MTNSTHSKIYLDNAATSYPKPPCVYEKTMDIFREFGVNASRGSYNQAAQMRDVEAHLKNNLTSLFGISDPDNVILTPSATIALNQIIQGLDFSRIKTVYISPFEHNATYRPILHMQKIYGFTLEIIPFSRFIWNCDKTKILFKSQPPDLVVLTHASNVFGNILPVKDIFTLAKQYDAITVLDGAQTAGVAPIDARAMQVDFVAFAGHKTLYGPSGIGGFIINSNIKLNPILFGGTGINSEEEDMPESYPERFEVGSMNSLGIIGLDLSVAWLCEVGIDNIRKRKESNLKALIKVLNDVKSKVELMYGEPNIGIISCRFHSYSSQEMAMVLDGIGVSVRAGLHCSPLAHKHLDTINGGGTVRFSVGFFNDIADFEKIKNLLGEL